MIKKRAMAENRWDDGLKQLVTGYAEQQPDYPYWVQPCHYDKFEWAAIDKWIRETMGDTDWSTPGGRWVGSNRKYWFRNEADRTFFILRWA